VPSLEDKDAASYGTRANGDHSFMNDEESSHLGGGSVAFELPTTSSSPQSAGGARGSGELPVPRLGFGATLHCYPHGRGVSTNALHVISAAPARADIKDAQPYQKRTASATTARLISVGADLCVRHWVLVPAAASSRSRSKSSKELHPAPLKLVLLSATRLESNNDTPYVLYHFLCTRFSSFVTIYFAL